VAPASRRLAALRQKFRKNFLPLCERSAHLAFDEQHVGEGAQRSESYLIFDDIADERPAGTVAGFGQKLVTVMPGLKRAFLLHVGKVVVPFEFSDAGDPPCSCRQERKQSKRSHDDGPDSDRARGSVRIRKWWRRDQMKFVHSGLRGCGHNARQVVRVREEGEDMRDREANPVFELELGWQKWAPTFRIESRRLS